MRVVKGREIGGKGLVGNGRRVESVIMGGIGEE